MVGDGVEAPDAGQGQIHRNALVTREGECRAPAPCPPGNPCVPFLFLNPYQVVGAAVIDQCGPDRQLLTAQLGPSTPGGKISPIRLRIGAAANECEAGTQTPVLGNWCQVL